MSWNTYLMGSRPVAARLAFAAMVAAAVSGCADRPPVVQVPIAAPCVNASDVPPEVPPAGPLPQDARQAADLLGSVVLQLRATDRELRALISGCVR